MLLIAVAAAMVAVMVGTALAQENPAPGKENTNANRAPSGENCTFQKGETQCTDTFTEIISQDIQSCGEGDTQTVTTKQEFRTTTTFKGKSGNVKDTNTEPVGDPFVEIGPCGGEEKELPKTSGITDGVNPSLLALGAGGLLVVGALLVRKASRR